jgi:FkbM family methyltransferase
MLMSFNDLWKKYKIKPRGVVHLGANTGQEAVEYVTHHVPFVIWVEALSDVCSQLQKNVARYPGHIVLKACLSDEDGKEVTFHRASNQGQSSSFLEFGTHSKEHPTVKWIGHETMRTNRLDTLLAMHGIELNEGWFLNADLQGAELLALKGMGKLLEKFDYAYIEVNERELYKGCALVGDIDEYLGRFGFVGKEVKMTGAGWGDKFYTRLV